MKRLKNLAFYTTILIAFLSTDLYAQTKKIQSTNGRTFSHNRRSSLQQQNQNTCPDSPFRSIDGTCNNISQRDQMEWGATDVQLDRTMLPEYGRSDRYNAMAGPNRPSARAVSNGVCNQADEILSPRKLSSFVFTWGQFLDHDIVLTPEGHTEYMPVELPGDEPLFTADIPFFRSEVHEGTGSGIFRQQTNLLTSWIDGSNVYGSDEERATWLRTFENGKLKTSEGDLLPFNTIDGEYATAIDPDAPSMAGDNGGTVKTYVAGDVRAAEQPGLTSLHLLFVRYHNNLCDQLIQRGYTDDEQMYQLAKREVSGVIQSITYNEFLPALGIRLSSHRGYNSTTKPNISNLFASAAYRLGHTMVTDKLLLKNDQCEDVASGEISLLEGFFNIEVLQTYDISSIFNGLAAQTQNAVDPFIIDNLRNFLFGDPNAPQVFGLDLASLNIQRGRDHGLPDYNEVRRKYTGRSIRRFRDITTDQSVRDALQSTYRNVDDIDVWVGMLSEDKLNGSSVGSTLHAVLKSQFEQLRDGDRYFYLHDRYMNPTNRSRIHRTRLSDVIKANTIIEDIQSNVFFVRDCGPQSNSRSDESMNATIESFELTLYPNPASEVLTIQLPQLDDTGASVLIIDNNGRVIQTTQVNQSVHAMNISGIAAGIYSVKVVMGDQIKIERFIKVE